MNNLVLSDSSSIDFICIIDKSKKWKNCIDIRIANDTSVNCIINHFLMLKSYLYSDKYVVIGISLVVAVKKEGDNSRKMIVVNNLNVNYMYRINFNDFISWYLSTYSSLEIYNSEYDDYEMVYRLRLNKLDDGDLYVPLFPWSESWVVYNSVSYYK